MSKMPEDVKNDLTKFSEESGTDIEEVKKMFKEEYNADYMSGYDEESGERAKQAAWVVRAELSNNFGGNVVYEGVIFQTTPVQEKETKNDPEKTYVFSDIFGMFKSEKDKKGGFKPVKIRCFGDAAPLTGTLPLNVPVKLGVSESDYQGRTNLAISNGIKCTVIESSKAGFNMRDFIISAYKKNDSDSVPMKIEEVKYKRSKDDDDKKVICGRVKRSSVKSSKKGNLLANYIIYDDERGPDEVMFVSTMLTEQLWESGALVWVVGTNGEPEEQYKDSPSESMFADFVVGILPKRVPQDKIEAMIQNAKKEQVAKSHSKAPAQVEDSPDTSGLKGVIGSSDTPQVKFDGWD